MREKDKNLPSIITRPIQPGYESVSTTTASENDFLPKKVTEMLSITRYTNGEVNKENIAQVVKILKSSSNKVSRLNL